MQVSLEDGEIFRNSRVSQLVGDVAEAEILQYQISPNTRENISRLYRNHHALGKAFDDLLVFKELWKRFELGTLPRILGMKCDEVI